MYPGVDGKVYTGFRQMSDEEVILLAKSGSRNAVEHLLGKYRGLVEGKAKVYFLAGADHDDVVQEGMIGLFKAIRDFRTDRLAGFRAFADLCVTRQIITAVKTAARHKHMPLNQYVSLHRTTLDGESDRALMDMLPDARTADPEKSALYSDMQDNLDGCAYQQLSSLELRVFTYYMQGMSYQEMAKLLLCHTKSVDNALQRAKRKIGQKIARD
jgi:RNA polymerase sporulation-specific sigma factor